MAFWVSEAYQMYTLGFTYPDLKEQFGMPIHVIKRQIKRYAFKHQLAYPRLKPNYELAFNLRMNTMTLNDIARYMGVSVKTAWVYIRTYSEMSGLHIKSNCRGQAAYDLRQQGYTYTKIAKMVGFENRSNCYRAIRIYKEKNNIC